MESIADVVEFCQSQATFHLRRAQHKKAGPQKVAAHEQLAAKFSSAAQILSAAPDDTDREPTSHEGLFVIDPFDLGDLPSELVEQLAIPQSDQDDAKIVRLLRLAQRPLSINEVMVALYRRFGEVQKRNAVNARLYRMTQRGDLLKLEKGVYTLPPTSGPDSESDADEEGS